jgi:glycolate oxidase iron-sulfur subunit
MSEGHWPEIGKRSLDCVHCGLCLSACPTYLETGREGSSPRGRIYLMRGVAEGRLPLGDALAEEAYLCLGCRACETACPSGVSFGAMLELTRAEVERAGLRRGLAKRVERLALRGVVPRRARLRLLVDLLGLAQALRLDRALAALLPRGLREAQALVPPVPPRRARRPLPELVPAQGARRGRVAFLSGCVMSELFAGVNAATVRVLARNGFDVVIPRAQGCCGALHAHAGDEAFAAGLARHNARVFAAAGAERLVVNSAGCGAALRDAGRWLPGEGEALAASVRDVCELLDAEGLRAPAGRLALRVAYDDPCHLVHAQRVSAAPRRVLAAIPGVEFVAHADAAGCCGAAGIYNLTHREMSRAVLARKLAALAAVDPDVVASGNPGCLMQLRAGARAAGLRARVEHPVVLLDEAYASESSIPSRRIL